MRGGSRGSTGVLATGRPLRIAIVQPNFNSTTVGWFQGLVALGHDVTVLVRSGGHPPGGLDGERTVALGNATLAGRELEVPNPFKVRAALRELDPDLVILKVDAQRNIVISLIAGLLGIRRIGWQEQLPPTSRRWRALAALGITPRGVFTALDARPGGIGLAHRERTMPRIAYASPMWPPVARPATDPLVTGVSVRGPEQPIRVLVVASFKNHVAKRQWVVLEAAARAGLLDGRLRFTFIGVGNEQHFGFRRVVEVATEHDALHLVEMRTKVDFGDMPGIFDAHDLVVLPSAREQFGMTVVEAMSRGLPLIVSDVIGAIGCVVPGETGFVFPANDMTEFAAQLALFAAEPQRLTLMGAAGKTFIEGYADPVRCATEMLQLAEQA